MKIDIVENKCHCGNCGEDAHIRVKYSKQDIALFPLIDYEGMSKDIGQFIKAIGPQHFDDLSNFNFRYDTETGIGILTDRDGKELIRDTFTRGAYNSRVHWIMSQKLVMRWKERVLQSGS